MPEPTRVYFTVDVECSEERVFGARVQPAMGYDLRVWGRFANQSKELGVAVIMDELEAYGFRGTFYVESIGAESFGLPGLRIVCDRLLERGHDVQLHVHPIQRDAYWHSNGRAAVDDNISGYTVSEQAALLREGLDILIAAGVPKDELTSYRAGNFGASNDTWEAMSRVGLVLSSNYNPFYFDLQCRMRSPEATNDLFKTPVDNVWELPISNFLQPNDAVRHLQITATSLEEMKMALVQSRQLGIEHVTLVTHSFEFLCIDSPVSRLGHANLVNLHRLRGLLRFLRDRPDEFVVETAGALGKRLVDDGDSVALSGQQRYPREKKRHYYRRLVEQGIKRIGTRISFP